MNLKLKTRGPEKFSIKPREYQPCVSNKMLNKERQLFIAQNKHTYDSIFEQLIVCYFESNIT